MTRKTLLSSWGRRVPDKWLQTPPASINQDGENCYAYPADINRSSSSSSDTWAGSLIKPHKANNDAGWEAIRSLRAEADGPLSLSHFRIIQKLGSGDMGSVYLAELKGTECNFAIKVRDKEALRSQNKTMRAETEREILEILDHPFLPTLYAHLDENRFTCLVMEVCPGGDLHEIRHRQPGKRFNETAARFYASEVLLAFEYLHMLGIVYRDLKPENVLVREDGHIMLTDFDLSLKCSVYPTLQRAPDQSDPDTDHLTTSVRALAPSPSRFFTACVIPCMSSGHRPQPKKKSKQRKIQAHHHSAVPLPELLAEPTDARSMSFVGTHEYLAPEMIAGQGHGNAVDWWTFGIFIFELLYGRTPFIGATHDRTLTNVVSEPLRFPDEEEEDNRFPDEEEDNDESVVGPPPSAAAKELIRALLVKNPTNRMAAARGAAEIKNHEFFGGVNWALLRSSTPPYLPTPFARPPPSEFEGY